MKCPPNDIEPIICDSVAADVDTPLVSVNVDWPISDFGKALTEEVTNPVLKVVDVSPGVVVVVPTVVEVVAVDADGVDVKGVVVTGVVIDVA